MRVIIIICSEIGKIPSSSLYYGLRIKNFEIFLQRELAVDEKPSEDMKHDLYFLLVKIPICASHGRVEPMINNIYSFTVGKMKLKRRHSGKVDSGTI